MFELFSICRIFQELGQRKNLFVRIFIARYIRNISYVGDTKSFPGEVGLVTDLHRYS